MSTLRVPAVILCLVVFSQQATADVYVPPGLQPGDKYHLIFVSQFAGPAGTKDVAFYNDLLHAQAMLNAPMTGTDQGGTYGAIASTLDIDGRDNTPVSAPIFLLDGTKIADGYADFWDGQLDNPINVDQFGNVVPAGRVWTGTMPDGTKWICPEESIFYQLGALFPRFGLTTATNGDWTGVNEDFNHSNYHFYGISSAFTVPGTIPEPASAALCAMMLLAVAGCARRRRIRSSVFQNRS